MACCDVYKQYLSKMAEIVQTYVWQNIAALLAVLHV